MKRTLAFRMVAAGVVALTSAVAVSTTTQTASANDYQIIYDNLDDALGVLLTGVGDAVNEYLATMSFDDAADVFTQALQAAGSALVAGTAQFGQLPLGLLLLRGAIDQTLDPFLMALDDPSLAADLFNPDDLSTIAANLLPAVELTLFGSCCGGVLSGVASGLEGEIIKPFLIPGLGTPALLGEAANGLLEGFTTLLAGTNYESLGTFALIGLILGAGAGESYIQSVEDVVAPVLTQPALATVLVPVAGLLRGLTGLPALPIALPLP